MSMNTHCNVNFCARLLSNFSSLLLLSEGTKHLSCECLVLFSNVVPYIVKPGRADSNDNMQHTVISKLKKVFVEASSQGNCKLQETVVLTIGQLGRIAEGELLLVVIVSLLESLTAHSQLIRAVAFKQVEQSTTLIQSLLCRVLLETDNKDGYFFQAILGQNDFQRSASKYIC